MRNLSNLPNYTDARGKIQMVLESCNIGSVSIIDSQAGSTRAKHWHPNDFHEILILDGQIEYYERAPDINGNYTGNKPVKIILQKGDVWYTPPKWEHQMNFPVWTSFLCLSKLRRDSENYEKETVRFLYDLKEIYDNWKD